MWDELRPSRQEGSRGELAFVCKIGGQLIGERKT